MGNLNLALEVAEKHLDIPKMLDAEGIKTSLLWPAAMLDKFDLIIFCPVIG